MTPDDLFRLYTLFGEDPFIRTDAADTTPRPIFSAWEVRPPALHSAL